MKTKRTQNKFLFVLTPIILILSMLLSSCSWLFSPDILEQIVKPVAKMVAITVSGQKSAFSYGEEFSTDGLVVTGIMSDNTTKVLSENEYVVDSSAYNKLESNVYTIYVSTKDGSLKTTYAVSLGGREILSAPKDESALYAYNNMDPAFNNSVLNYPDTFDTPDPTWEGRYKVSVYTPGNEENAQEVGILAAFSQLFSSTGGFSSYGMFDFNGSVTVRITTNFYFENVDIRPASLNIEWYRVEDMENTVEFTLTKPCNISVEFDGDTLKNLMLFSDSMMEYSKPSDVFVQDVIDNVTDNDNLIIVEPGSVDPDALKAQYSDTKHNVIVFGAGLYHIQISSADGWGRGEIYFPSNSTVYIHGDAAIYGGGRVTNANNVTIKGRGIFNGQSNGSTSYLFHTANSTNVTVQGITLNHSFGWNNCTTESRGVVFRNVRVCGSCRNNNDGFDICNSSDVLVDGCFIRTIDDCITIKGRFSGVARNYVENILIQNTVVWNYQGGNGICVGSESCADVYNNIVYRDIDIIHNTTNRAIMIELIDSADMTNVVFDDIRCELDSTFSHDHKYYDYTSDWDNGGWLLMLKLIPNSEAYYGTDTYPGSVDGVTLNNITFNGNPARKIVFSGIDEEHNIKNIAINNCVFNGTLIDENNFNDFLDVDASKYYSNVTFNGSAGNSYDPDKMLDDKELSFSTDDTVRNIEVTDSEACEGAYTNYCIARTNSIDLRFVVDETGYTVPSIRYKQSPLGGVFEIFIDGKSMGLLDTYSENGSFSEYYLPWQFLTAGQHTLTVVAKYLPNEGIKTNTLDFNFDGIQLISEGSNYIEFEKLTSITPIIKDNLAMGGYAVEVSSKNGITTFKGNSERELHAQWFLTYLAGPDKGIYKFYLGDDLISTDIDMYAEEYEYRTVALDTVLLSKGDYVIKAKYIGKNSLSSGSGCQLDNIYLRQFAVSKTYKGGYDGVYKNAVASSGVSISKGHMQPIVFSNIVNGSTVSVAEYMGMPNDGIFMHHVYMSNFDPSLYILKVNGVVCDYEYKDGVISFLLSRACGGSKVEMTFEYIGSGTRTLSFVKLVIDPVVIDKSELRALIQTEDSRVISSSIAKYLKENYQLTLNAAKEVLIDPMADERTVEVAVEALKAVSSKLGNAAVCYNTATLTDAQVEVSFLAVDTGSLAILYLNDGSGNASEYYATVSENGKAIFTVGDEYIGQSVKLYCEVVGEPLAGAVITQGDKISVASSFTFSDEYWKTDAIEAFYFASLRETELLTVTFDSNTVKAGEIAMLSLRNSLNEELGTYYAQLSSDCTAVFNIKELAERDNVYAVATVSQNNSAVAVKMQADKAVIATANINDILLGLETSTDITITASLGGKIVDEQGVHYTLASGYTETNIGMFFDGDFDSLMFDWSITSCCGAGGDDKVFVYSSDGATSLTSFRASLPNGSTVSVTKTGQTTVTAEECGSGVVLKIWVGCYGDNIQCKSDTPHGDELLKIGTVKFYNDATGERTTLKLIGGNTGETPSSFVEYQKFDSLSGIGSLTAEGLELQDGAALTAIIKDEIGNSIADYTATVSSGKAVFAVSGYSYDGKVKVYLQASDGTFIKSEVLTAEVTRSLHLGQLLASQGTVDEWQGNALNASMNMSSDGILYNDTSKYTNGNWYSGNPASPARYGLDYSFTWLGDMSDLQSLSISYRFQKICNCGGGDVCYIYNGTTRAFVHSAQDQTSGITYTTTFVADKATIDSYTSNEFTIFYWFGCSLSNASHVGEELELGTMTYTYLIHGEASLEAVK